MYFAETFFSVLELLDSSEEINPSPSILMPSLLCRNGHLFNAPDGVPTAVCPTCQEYVATGLEHRIRAEWEQATAIAYPKVTAARAIALANGIYKTAINKKNKHNYISMTTAERKLRKKGYEGQIVQSELIRGRGHGGLYQDSCTAAVVAIDNGPTEPLRISIYVVFRGSASDSNVGGWVENREVNLDWRANFDNRMETTDYAGTNIRIHRGFKSVLGTYRGDVRRALSEMRRRIDANGHRHHTVITGHSQGAAHALLFAHWLAYVDRENPATCIPYSPPRVGDYDFARDFSRLISNRVVCLPYDGWRTENAFLMVKGLDPVSFNQKRASGPEDDRLRNRIIDKSGLLKKASNAGKWEAENSVAEQPFYHPKNLVLVSSSVPKLGLLKAVDHHPGLFRDKILGKF